MSRFPIRMAMCVVATGMIALALAACGSDEGMKNVSLKDVNLKPAIAQYRSTLKEDAANLVVKTGKLKEQIEAEDLGKAESRYATSRVRYSQVEPIAVELFPALARRIDAYADEVPAKRFGGFHRIERALFVSERTSGMAPVARRLYADVEDLRQRLRTVPLRPEPIARGAAKLIAGVSPSLIAGTEEPYSDTDLVDVSANVEGVEAAFKALRPLLVVRDAPLVKRIETEFRSVYARLEEYGTPAREPEQPSTLAPGAIFREYSEVSRAEVRRLARPIAALAGQLAKMPTLVAEE